MNFKLSSFNPFATQSADKKPAQKADAKALLTDTSFALDQIDLVDSDALLDELGVSRSEVLDRVFADDEVESCIDDLRAEMSAADWRVWGDGVDDETVNPLYKNLRKHLPAFIELSIVAKLNGYAVAEYEYEINESGALEIKRVISKKDDLESFRPRRDGSLAWKNNDGNEVLLNTNVKHILITSGATGKKPSGEIKVAKLYPALQLRKMGFLYAGQFIKRHGQPYIVAKTGGLSDDKTNWLQKIFAFLNGGGMTIGADDEVALHQLNGDAVAFKRLENMSNARIQKLILGRVKTSDLESGSRAAQETDDTVRKARISAYLDLLELAMQHAVDALVAVNAVHGVEITAPKGLWFEFNQPIRIDTKRAERDKHYLDTGHIRLKKEYFTQILGFEDEHIEMLEKSEASTPDNKLGVGDLLLSDDKSEAKPLNKQHLKLLQPKIDTILSTLANSKDYADFESKLDDLSIGDEALILALAQQNAHSYVDGLTEME